MTDKQKAENFESNNKLWDLDRYEFAEAYMNRIKSDYDSFLLQLLSNYNLPEINQFFINQSEKNVL